MQIIPRPVNQTVYQALQQKGYDQLTCRLLAARVDDQKRALNFVNPSLQQLTPPDLLKDIDLAVDRVIQALEQQQVIGLETDHDCDGQTAQAVLYEGLTGLLGHPPHLVKTYIGHRLKEGYGLSDSVAKRIDQDQPRAQLIITADNGSTDEPRIRWLKDRGIDTIVTDHHGIPDQGVPVSAVAVLNPVQSGERFPDPSIAGCMVAWLLIAAVRQRLKTQQRLPKHGIQLADLLDYVAIGTIADCVSMANSLNNRLVVHYGMHKIAQRKRPCWQALLNDTSVIDSQLLGFQIAPLLNSDGRLSDALSSVNLLLSKDMTTVKSVIDDLQQQNQQRKQIQKTLFQTAKMAADQQIQAGALAVCVYLDDGHAGVHGIVASQLKTYFGYPVVLFSPGKSDTLISGSARSIDGLHMKTILDQINQIQPDLLVQYGGHAGAAGMSIVKTDFDRFQQLFVQQISTYLNNHSEVVTGPSVYTDGTLQPDELTQQTYQQLQRLGPFGRGFEAPIFVNQAYLTAIRFVGNNQVHAQLRLKIGQKILKGIWFFAADYPHVNYLTGGQWVTVVYELSYEVFQGTGQLNLKVVYLEKL